jgi:exopolysaccharide production protein ExoQ
LGVFVLREINYIPHSARAITEKLLIWGAAITIALLLFESVTGAWLTRTGRGLPWYEVINPQTGGINIEAFLRNGVVILTILMWPILSALTRQRHFLGAALFLVLTIYLVFRFSSTTALVAIIAGGIGIGLASSRRKLASLIVGSMFVILLLGAPFLVHQVTAGKNVQEIGQFSYDLKLPNSATSRLIIWQFAAQHIFEKPFFGWGMNMARKIPDSGEKYTLKVVTPTGKNIVLFRESYMPLHPHNAALQIWLELGAVGALIVAVFGWLFIRKLENMHTDPVIFGVVISILAFNFISFGAWQSWWIATQFLCLGLTLVTSRRNV